MVRLWGSASTALPAMCATDGSTVFVIQLSGILSFYFQLFICQTLFIYLSVHRLCVRISKAINIIGRYHPHTGKCKSTGAGCNELVQSKLRTGVRLKWRKR